jgi:hypothetical protein
LKKLCAHLKGVFFFKRKNHPTPHPSPKSAKRNIEQLSGSEEHTEQNKLHPEQVLLIRNSSGGVEKKYIYTS